MKAKGCPECAGYGTTARYFREQMPDGVREVSIACICHRCAMGDFLRSEREADPHSVYHRLRDLASNRWQEYRSELAAFPSSWHEGLANDRRWHSPSKLPPGEATAWCRRIVGQIGADAPERTPEAKESTPEPEPVVWTAEDEAWRDEQVAAFKASRAVAVPF